MEWLTADDARRMSTGEMSKIMYEIKEAAYKGKFQIILDYNLSKELGNILHHYGYKIIHETVPIYEEAPYGVRFNILGHKFQTTVSWHENRNLTDTTL